MYDFAIIGAGYGGLTAAALLAQKGRKVLVVEKAKYAGGRSFYFESDGFVWQYGQHSHRLEKDGIAAQVFERLGDSLEFVLTGKGLSRLFYKGRLIKRPEGLMDFVTTEAMPFKARLVFIRFYLSLLKQNPHEWHDKTLYEFYRRSFDNEEVEAFLSFLGFTVMLPDIRLVSAGEVIDFIKRAKKAKIKQGEPVGGAKQVIDKLVNSILKNGGEITLGETVKEIILKGNTARGVVTTKGVYDAENVVYAAPVKGIFDLIDPDRFDAAFVEYKRNIRHSSGIVIDFVSKEPLADFPGGILGVDVPLWVKFQTLIDPSVAPPGYHVCTWGLLNRPGAPDTDEQYTETENQLRAIAAICMPGFEKKVIKERKMVMPVINANMLIPVQSKPYRTPIKSSDIDHLYFVGDTTQGEGCSGDIAFSSGMKLAEMAG